MPKPFNLTLAKLARPHVKKARKKRSVGVDSDGDACLFVDHRRISGTGNIEFIKWTEARSRIE